MKPQQLNTLISRLKNHKLTLTELCDTFKETPESLVPILEGLKQSGIPVTLNTEHSGELVYHINVQPQAGNVYVISQKDSKERNMKFGLASDLHFSSLFHLPKTFHTAMKILEDRGITRVYIAGDIVDGYGIYPGHLENLIEATVERQTDVAATEFSKHPGLEFWGIAGNHDYSHTKMNGVRPLALIENKCDNFKNLGEIRADVIYHGIRIRLLHGAGGRSYSLSYPTQCYLRDYFKGLDRSEMANVPHIMGVGHYHTQYFSKDHGVYILQPGSFQSGENEYCARRGLTGPNGCFLVDCDYKNGQVTSFRTEYIEPAIGFKEKGMIAQGKRIDS